MMKKNLIAVSVAVAVVLVIGIVFIAKPFARKGPVTKTSVAQKVSKAAAKAPAKKMISKDMGGLTVRILNSKKQDAFVKIRAFKASDSRSSVFIASFASNRMVELLPGNYDIELDTIPQKIYKGISVAKGRETVEDLGRVSGSLIVKILNSKKREAAYPVRILYTRSNMVVTSAMTNRPVEVLPGSYDVEIGITPKIVETNVRVESGKDAVLDLGAVTGAVVVKAADENKKEAKYGIRVRKAANNELVVSGITNRPTELLQGTYNIEIASVPVQVKKDVKVNAGEEVALEFLVQVPVTPARPAAVPVKTKAAPAAPVSASAKPKAAPTAPVAAPVQPAPPSTAEKQ